QILQQRFHDVGTTGFAALLLGPVDSAKFQACATHRFLARHAGADQIFCVGFDVEAQFGIHFAFHTRAVQSRPQPGMKPVPERHTSSGLVPRIPAITSVMRFHLSASLWNLRFPAEVSRSYLAL